MKKLLAVFGLIFSLSSVAMARDDEVDINNQTGEDIEICTGRGRYTQRVTVPAYGSINDWAPGPEIWLCGTDRRFYVNHPFELYYVVKHNGSTRLGFAYGNNGNHGGKTWYQSTGISREQWFNAAEIIAYLIL